MLSIHGGVRLPSPWPPDHAAEMSSVTLSAAADLERSEIPVPIALRHFRIRVDPKPKMIEVGFLASAAKNHSAHLVTEAFDIFGIGRIPEPFGEIEELLLFALLRLYAVLDQF
jgi:hypothetical protein